MFWLVLFASDYLTCAGRFYHHRGKAPIYIGVKAAWILVSAGVMLLAVFVLIPFMFHSQKFLQRRYLQERKRAPPSPPLDAAPLESIAIVGGARERGGGGEVEDEGEGGVQEDVEARRPVHKKKPKQRRQQQQQQAMMLEFDFDDD